MTDTLATEDDTTARKGRRGIFRRRDRKDGGFSLIEIMAGMAIIAILALAILPQFSKYFERAAVQNLSQEVQQASQIVESDYSLTGQSLYVGANVTASLGTVKKSAQSTLTGSLLTSAAGASTATSDYGYMIKGTNPGVSHYNIWYCSLGNTPGLHVASSTTTPAC